MRKPEKDLTVKSNQTTANLPDKNKNLLLPSKSPQILNLESTKSVDSIKESNSQIAQQKRAVVFETKRDVEILNGQTTPGQETFYYCGARTKKGAPCTRRVKTSGRCWQHAGQTAMVPPEKLTSRR